MVHPKSLLAGIALTCFTSLASAAIVDFEGFATGTIIDNEYQASQGITINGVNTDRNASNLAVIFNTAQPTGGDVDLAAPFSNNRGLGNLDPGKVLIIHEHPGNCSANNCPNPDDEGSRPAGYFSISFNQSVTLNSIDFFDVEGRETAANAIRLFDANNNEIAANTFFTPNTGGDNQWDRVDFGIVGVKSIQINMGGSGAIDNINYSAVPVPAAIWFMGSALLGLAGISRKRG